MNKKIILGLDGTLMSRFKATPLLEGIRYFKKEIKKYSKYISEMEEIIFDKKKEIEVYENVIDLINMDFYNCCYKEKEEKKEQLIIMVINNRNLVFELQDNILKCKNNIEKCKTYILKCKNEILDIHCNCKKLNK